MVEGAKLNLALLSTEDNRVMHGWSKGYIAVTRSCDALVKGQNKIHHCYPTELAKIVLLKHS